MFHTCPSKRTVSVRGTQAPHLRNHPKPSPAMPMMCLENSTAAWRTGFTCMITTRPAPPPLKSYFFIWCAHPPSPTDALTTIRAHPPIPPGIKSDPHHHPYDPTTANLEIHSAIVSRQSRETIALKISDVFFALFPVDLSPQTRTTPEPYHLMKIHEGKSVGIALPSTSLAVAPPHRAESTYTRRYARDMILTTEGLGHPPFRE